MSILSVIILFAVVGFCLWLIVTYVPMPDPMPKVLVAVVVIILVIWIAKLLFGDIAVPTLR